MATGFISRHCRAAAALFLALAAASAWAQDVVLVGTFGDKAAVLVIDGGPPRTLRVGGEADGVKLLSVAHEGAVVEIAGAKRTLARGQAATSSVGEGRQSVTLSADTRGHFVTMGAINDRPVQFVVDTGATYVALPASEATRVGLDYRKGQIALTKTAAGVVPVYRVRLDKVRLGGIELSGVDGVVIEQGLDITLLGMSFLNRVDMRHEGQLMTLTRRY
ncbi:MAG TPA: TIGR02281 family clan AA aspartic protease [Burkholderiales bacterium]|nr:TIGR02281 family clan AA aspartic protease [Burkholderiales bacterium]